MVGMINIGAQIDIANKKTRNLLHWLNSSMFSRTKYKNIRQHLQEKVPVIFGKANIFKRKDVLLDAATVLQIYKLKEASTLCLTINRRIYSTSCLYRQ
ncbi:hypothetical protein NTGBS_610003 [Candidatus Nitrotoga sp. BS]|nr:hypothetical protein NTGBS_610003 [Candidatus Nitrotoga sp. BS]